jgi:hypothetical protein
LMEYERSIEFVFMRWLFGLGGTAVSYRGFISN